MSLVFLAIGCAKPPPVRDPKTFALAHAADVAAFDEVWSQIGSTYPDPAQLSGGAGRVDWPAARRELRPKVEHAATREAARVVIRTLLRRLDESHFNLLPAASTETQDTNRETGEVGITLRVLDGRAIAWRVAPASPAARAGIRPGWRLDRVDATKLADVIADERKSEVSSPTRLQHRVQDTLAVATGQILSVTFVDGQNKSHDLRLVAASAESSIARLGDLPPMSLRIDATTLPGGVGYFALSSFLDPPRVMPMYDAFIRAPSHANGLILDLRGNPGGISGMATGMAGYFTGGEMAELGTMVTRDGRLPFTINPRLPAYPGKLAILVDALTASTSEIFAAGLQDRGRARIFGERTAGAALPSSIVELANGDRLQFVIADFLRPNGQRIEGLGVTPDQTLHLTRIGLLGGHDEPLEAAQRWLRSGPATQATTRAATFLK